MNGCKFECFILDGKLPLRWKRSSINREEMRLIFPKSDGKLKDLETLEMLDTNNVDCVDLISSRTYKVIQRTSNRTYRKSWRASFFQKIE
jgi:hypothetical protein